MPNLINYDFIKNNSAWNKQYDALLKDYLCFPTDPEFPNAGRIFQQLFNFYTLPPFVHLSEDGFLSRGVGTSLGTPAH